MNAPVTKLHPESEISDPLDPLAKLRAPFPDNLVSKLPKETKAQALQRKSEQDKGNWPPKCAVCDGYHHKNAVHLDYVGHAALTSRLLDVDPQWSWEPMAFRDGLPAFDGTGGLWIKLTICGVSRLGYGHAAVKPNMDPGAREKEVIGDALRNAAMRFGAALDLWHKGDLHAHEEPTAEGEASTPEEPFIPADERAIGMLRAFDNSPEHFKEAWNKNKDGWKKVMTPEQYARVVAVMKEIGAKFAAPPPPPPPPPPKPPETTAYDIGDDEIPF